jgi:hypothetical protein
MVRVETSDRYIKVETTYGGEELLPIEVEHLIAKLRQAVTNHKARRYIPRAFTDVR